LRRYQGRKFLVSDDFHGENCLPALDFVAVGEHRILDARAIQKRAVAALAVLDAAAARPALDGKVHARHKRVMQQSKLRPPRRPPNGHRLARLQADDLPRHRPFFYFENYSHALRLGGFVMSF
jgi:hypothetical protein